ncbi:MAG: hypothetical protein Q8862_00930 [Bacteroidota bacterium]|nr:hypothetical protein [Bacteroidota bacterium]
MKKIAYQIINMIFLLVLLSSCNFKGDTNKKLYDFSEVESFNLFLQKFYSDSIFQINRIIFPLISETENEIEKKTNAEKDPNSETDSIECVLHNKNNWITLNDSAFGNDSIAIIDGIKFKRRFYKSDKFVEERVLYAEPEQVVVIIKFKLINKRWYLIDYQNELDNERS